MQPAQAVNAMTAEIIHDKGVHDVADVAVLVTALTSIRNSSPFDIVRA